MKPNRNDLLAALDMMRSDLERMDETQLGDTLHIWEIAITNGILRETGK